MDNYYLIIDNRETKLIEIFKTIPLPPVLDTFKIEIKPLKLGDIVISKTNGTSNGNSNGTCNGTSNGTSNSNGNDNIYLKENLIMVFERKTMTDLLSSINDGRWREQKARLLANVENSKVCYLIENQISDSLNKYRKNGKSIVRGALVNKCFRDNLRVIRTDNLFETKEFLITICKRIVSNPELFSGALNTTSNTSATITTANANQANYIDTVKIAKKDNIDKTSFSVLSLTIIPGISTKIAKVIIDKYKTLTNLVMTINNDDNDTIKELSEIQITITGGKTRRVGKVIANRIVSFLEHSWNKIEN
jgi:ERCC4-type nuclease